MDSIPGHRDTFVRSILIAFALTALAVAMGQVTTETVDLVGAVATVSEFQEYPESTERNLRQTMAFRPDGTAAERESFSYSFIDGSLRSRSVTTYDDQGRPLATVEFDPDGNPQGETAYRYDAAGQLIEQTTYDADGTETRRVVYERDAAGHPVVEEWYVDGALSRRFEREFDAQGREVEEREFREGRLTELQTYSEPGRVRNFEEYDDEGEIETTGTIVSGEHGLVQWTGYDADGQLQYDFAWTYGENGIVLERREVYGTDDPIVYTYAYEFDSEGNWIRRVTTEQDGDRTSVYEVEDRQITYH